MYRACGSLPPLAATWDPKATVCEEVLTSVPSGGDKHWWVQVEKRGLGTTQARAAVGRAVGLQPEDVSHGGHRDRLARSIQWFSLPSSKVDHVGPLRRAGAHGNMTVLKIIGANRPMAVDAVAKLRWKLRLRGAGGHYPAARALAERLRIVGLPNRIGRVDAPLVRWGELLLSGKRLPAAVAARRPDPRRLMLAVQSDRFNRWLDMRIRDNLLDKVVVGDRLCGPEPLLVDDPAPWQLKVTNWSAHVGGPLLGRSLLPTHGIAAEREQFLLAGLDHQLVKQLDGGLRTARIHIGRLALDPAGADLDIQAELPVDTWPDALICELIDNVGPEPTKPETLPDLDNDALENPDSIEAAT